MKRRHARQIRAGLNLARRDALTLSWSGLALIYAPRLTRAAYERASDRFLGLPEPRPLPRIPARKSPDSRSDS